MEIGLREVLVVIGVAIIGIILLDGFRRVRRSHNSSLKVSWKLGDELDGNDEDDSIYRAELPGKARKMERAEPGFSEQDLDVGRVDEQADPIFSTGGQVAGSDYQMPEFKVEQQELFTADSDASSPLSPSFESSLSSRPIEEIIVINVVAKDDPFRGDLLLEALLSCGMRFGRMNIFHRHEKSNGEGAELFSMANVTEPGFFDINKMDDFETKGVCLFMSLPGPTNVQLALDLLIDSGRRISTALGGEMRDENHSVLTQQTIEHYRQRVSDFERKQLSARVTS